MHTNLKRMAQLQMSSHILPKNRLRGLSSLDLELGEDTVWDEHDEYFDTDGDMIDDTIFHSDKDNQRDWSKSMPASKQHTAQEILQNFDPDKPPSIQNPEQLQFWIECEAHQEGLAKYQKVLDDARHRKDYSSLSTFQKQVLRWFPLLRDDIAERQSSYLLKKNEKAEKAEKRYGPYLCALSPEKLAVIAAHEALMYCLLKPGTKGLPGVPFVGVVKRLGEAVEQEVLVHRLLHKRSMEHRQRMKNRFAEGNEVGEDPKEKVEDEDPSKDQDGKNQTTGDGGNVLKSDTVDPAIEMPPVNWSYAVSHLNNYLEELSQNDVSVKKRRVFNYAIRKARQVLSKEEWSDNDHVGLGAILFHSLLENATVSLDGVDVPAFTHEKRWVGGNKMQAVVILNKTLHERIVSDKASGFSNMTTRYKPMILPPKPWMSTEEGGYLWLKSELMRYHGCNMQKDALQNADMTTLYQGLNVLGQVPWKINKRILEVAWECWDKNIPIGDIPSRDDFDVPPEPIPPPPIPSEVDRESFTYKQMLLEQQAYKDAMAKYRRFRQKNMDLNSLRCSAMLKLDQAEKFRDFDKIYFPYVSPFNTIFCSLLDKISNTLLLGFSQNVDFRGRAYPIPPHLSNVGSDLSRGLLMFHKSKPLGKRGLFWLKVHLANLAGMDKMTFEDRAAFVDKHFEQVRQSATSPFDGDRWWMELDDPFQGLATCVEIVNAVDSGNPETYLCSLPVHMDGSCNGLQHYAALGRDRIGGKAVNLCADEEPQDVYIGVMHEVIRRVAEDAERELPFDTTDVQTLNDDQKTQLRAKRAATLVNGLIDRGVVKRTVMTSVYGVTYIGARTQIQEKIQSKLEGLGHDIDEIDDEVFRACGYLATITMQAVGDLFVGAKQTMDWLTVCARMITQHGYPVAWISPIGVPAIQPYRQRKSSTIVTLLQTVTLTNEHDDLPIHKARQVSAFPPNYVHSLDSSHMLLTALEMDKRGLAFSAVHDSFWTHPCDIDEMNEALREVFIKLYSQPLLQQLKSSWEMRYPDLEFPDLPPHGTLNLEEVKEAPYFFQ